MNNKMFGEIASLLIGSIVVMGVPTILIILAVAINVNYFDNDINKGWQSLALTAIPLLPLFYFLANEEAILPSPSNTVTRLILSSFWALVLINVVPLLSIAQIPAEGFFLVTTLTTLLLSLVRSGNSGKEDYFIGFTFGVLFYVGVFGFPLRSIVQMIAS